MHFVELTSNCTTSPRLRGPSTTTIPPRASAPVVVQHQGRCWDQLQRRCSAGSPPASPRRTRSAARPHGVRMKLVVFGLTISSSWGNGHATLWRGLVKALVRRGHRVVFFERDVPYYAGARDLWEIPGGELVLYPAWDAVLPYARSHLADADVAMVTSYCPDAVAAAALALDGPAALRVFYDLDPPVTLDGLRSGREVPYLPPDGLGGFDLVLSFTGGEALTEL